MVIGALCLRCRVKSSRRVAAVVALTEAIQVPIMTKTGCSIAAALTTVVLATVLEAQAAADAVPTAMCVSKAMQHLGDDPSSVERSNALKQCLTEGEVYSLGWFEQPDTSQVMARCKLKRTDALRKGDDGRLNSAAVWEPIKDDLDKLPFFRGQNDSRDLYRASSASVRDDLIRDFGPSGRQFPSLVY